MSFRVPKTRDEGISYKKRGKVILTPPLFDQARLLLGFRQNGPALYLLARLLRQDTSCINQTGVRCASAHAG